MTREPTPYRPMLSDDDAQRLRLWHEAAYQEMRQRGTVRLSYLNRDLVVPEDVFAPTPVSDLLGNAVLEEARQADRVLDMGTGSGVNAILAASRSEDVVGVDVIRMPSPLLSPTQRATASPSGRSSFRTRLRCSRGRLRPCHLRSPVSMVPAARSARGGHGRRELSSADPLHDRGKRLLEPRGTHPLVLRHLRRHRLSGAAHREQRLHSGDRCHQGAGQGRLDRHLLHAAPHLLATHKKGGRYCNAPRSALRLTAG